MNTIYQIQADTYSQLLKVQSFLKENPDIKHVLVSYPSEPYSKEYKYVPNYEFLSLCGSENLTKDGYISEEAAINVLVSYAKQNHLYFQNYIELNEYLQSVLKTSDTFIIIQNLRAHLSTLFKKLT